MMKMADVESRLLNYQKSGDELASLIFSDDKPKTLAEAQGLLKDFKRTLQVLYIQNKDLHRENESMNHQLSQAEEQKVSTAPT